MRVSKIEIFGFKSFMDRLILNLDEGITGVVGPNGCGKSNIVDAIRWVLGETRAKNLRGGVLEDIIFNGTDDLRPLGLAEVSITVQADGEHFLEDLVSQDSEADQLMIDDINLREEDTELQVESIGSKYAVGSLLEKYSWLKAASEVQVTRRLYRSGESEFFINRVQCRLKDMKDFFRAIGLSAKGFTIVAQGEVSKIITSKPEQRRRFLEEAAGVQGFRERINSTTARLKETEVNLERIEDIITEVSRTVSSLKRQATKAENREELKKEILALDLTIYRQKIASFRQRELSYQAEVSAVQESVSSAEESYQTSYREDQKVRSELIAIDQASDELRSKVDRVRTQLNQLAASKLAKSSQLKKLEADLASAEREQLEITERIGKNKQRIDQSAADQEKLKIEKESLLNKSQELEKNNNAKQEEVYQQLQVEKTEQQNLEKQFRSLREELISYQTEHQTLSSQVDANLKPEELKKLAQDLNLSHDPKVLLEGIQIDAEYMEALEAVLAEEASFIVSEQPANLVKQFMETIRESKLSIGFLQSGSADLQTHPLAGFTPILSLVTCQSEFQSAAKALLDNVYIADTPQQAWEYFEQNKQATNHKSIKFVTQDGVLIRSNCIYFASKSTGLLKVQDRIAELEGLIDAQTTKADNCKAERDNMLVAIQKTQSSYDALRQASQAIQAESRELSSKIGAINGRLQSEERLMQQLTSDVSQLEERTERCRDNHKAWSLELEGMNIEPAEEAAVDEDNLQAQLAELTAQYKSEEEVRLAKRSTLDQSASQLNTLRLKLDQAKQKFSSNSLEKEKIALERQMLVEGIEANYGSEFFEEHNLSNAAEEVELISTQELTETKAELTKLKNRLIREGEIDPESISRYQEEKERLEDLEAQKADLSSALRSIRETLEKLRDTSEIRFQETFEQVASNFSRLVPKLFGGGHGELSLSDPENPLESGLDIMAKPPGKNLKNIELMSGGEKAMCATALIVSMFMVRPSPLCILDEVDAPLDEANLARFLGVVKEMSTQTQFLLITHNKQSMSVADKLVGVTMQQPGASKVLSVGLSEAYAQVA